MRYDYIKIDENGYAVEVDEEMINEELDVMCELFEGELFEDEINENDNYEFIDEDELELVEVK